MKKLLILLLLLAATIAVAWRYWFPLEFPQITPVHVLTKRAPEDVSQVTRNKVIIRSAVSPNYPLAEVEDAVYKENTDVAGSDVFEILKGSSLEWVRTDGDERYPGEVDVTEGKIAVKDGAIVAGAFVIDMSSIRLQGGDPKILEKIISPSDLNITEYEQASFILQESEGGAISGILTIKGTSKQITFPALILINDEKLRLYAEFSLERTYWGIGEPSPTLSPYIDITLERLLQQ